MPSSSRPCLAAVGPRSSAIVKSAMGVASSRGMDLLVHELGIDESADALELIARVGAVTAALSSAECNPHPVIAADGYSQRDSRAVRLMLERMAPSVQPIVFMVPPYPYEKRLDGRYRFNVGVFASTASSRCLVVDVKYGDELLSLPSEEFEASAQRALAEVLLDMLWRAAAPPLSDLLGDGGGYALMVGAFSDARKLAVAGAGYGQPAVAVVRDGAAVELLSAAEAAARVEYAKVDVTGGTASYLVTRREDLAREDPIYEVLGSRYLDQSPSLPAKIGWLPALYEI